MSLSFPASVLRHPAAVALGCGLALVVLATAIGDEGASLRTGAVPLALSIFAGTFGLAFAQAGWRGAGLPERATKMAALLAAMAFAGLAAFFLSLAVLYSMDSALLDSDTALSQAGTAAASVLLAMVIPAAVVVFSVGFVRDPEFPLPVRTTGLLFLVVMARGLLGAGVADDSNDPVVIAGALLLLSALSCLMTFGISRHRSSRAGNRKT